jgi:hypothetical protein
MRQRPLASGGDLIRRWGLPVVQARFHRDGMFFMPPTRFPVAFCDPQGYVAFRTAEEFRAHPKLRKLGPRVHVSSGISSLPGYVQVPDPIR